MQQTISFITLGVSDLARSRAFYGALGWQEAAASQAEVAFFQAGGVVLALFPRQALAEDAGVASAGQGFAGFSLAHNVTSEAAVDSLLAAAQAVGATCPQPASRAPWGGYRGYFADPDGFLWEVCFNPFMPLASDGSLRLAE
ncbi:MAG: VOC family protein [Dechloromonas sp.]|nr:VOC family protein [Dechloromonas sp.]